MKPVFFFFGTYVYEISDFLCSFTPMKSTFYTFIYFQQNSVLCSLIFMKPVYGGLFIFMKSTFLVFQDTDVSCRSPFFVKLSCSMSVFNEIIFITSIFMKYIFLCVLIIIFLNQHVWCSHIYLKSGVYFWCLLIRRNQCSPAFI